MSNNEQINVPTLLAIIAVSGLVLRYLFFSTPASSRAAQTAARESSTARNREAAVAQLQQMFPQVDRRTLLWDLQRTGGNIAATTERVLAGRLETPPQTFQPPPPPSPPASQAAAPASQSTTTTTTAATTDTKPSAPDLITRYHLQDKLASTSTEPQEGGAESSQTGGGGGEKGTAGKAWSSNKEERQSLLQRRRDQMILEARRKMEARIRAEKEKAEGAGGGS
ncbi:hypothetical protein GE09DRAFT_1206841 [Coniochaeta sp. 2T2.1]|nr:hypothetical protein GE09DRAFT_1206841 [Coniochaeta sp. 2T2.1]